MKALQNDLTTIEQSKRLLEIGVPKNSANHYYGKDGKLHYIDGTIPYSLLWETGCTPCWSVGRLMEICKICGSYELAKEIYGRALMYLNTVDGCICEMSYEISKGNLDFSKLED